MVQLPTVKELVGGQPDPPPRFKKGGSMARRQLWCSFFALCLLFTFLGCAAVSRSIENYKACEGDQVCMDGMQKVKESSYAVAKAASSNIPLPSAAEVIAVVVSNALSFGYGVFHGKKKG